MDYAVKMPRIGAKMREGTIGRWLKKEGERVEKGEPLLIILSDKAEFEIESPVSGIVKKLLGKVDESFPVDADIAVIAEEAESLPMESMLLTKIDSIGTETREGVPIALESRNSKSIAPSAKRIIEEQGIDIFEINGSGPEGMILEEDVVRFANKAKTERPKQTKVSPLAKKLAERFGVNIANIKGSGPHGRIVREDVQMAYKTEKGPEVKPEEERKTSVEIGGIHIRGEIPFTGVRKTIAERMLRSWSNAPMVTQCMEIDMASALDLAKSKNSEWERDYGVRVSLNDFIIRATTIALRNVPIINSTIDGNRVLLYEDINIGIAVSFEKGLIVPVIRNAERKSLFETAIEARKLIEKARNSKLTPDEISGGTFTVSNLSRFGIDFFTPIINPPESAILGVGRVSEKMVPDTKGGFCKKSTCFLCLSYDHRVIDGVPAAEFLGVIKELLETPAILSSRWVS